MCECGIKDCVGHPNGDTTLPGRTEDSLKQNEKSPDALKCCINSVNCTLTCCDTERQAYINERTFELEFDGKMLAKD